MLKCHCMLRFADDCDNRLPSIHVYPDELCLYHLSE